MSKPDYTVYIKRMPDAQDIPLPQKMSELAAGFDLYAAVSEPTVLAPGERTLVPAGFSMEMPSQLEAQIRPRSGLALKHGITCLNSPGTIDADYRGEVRVLLVNLGQEPFTVHRKERIAQMVFHELPQVQLKEAVQLADTSRGEGGFGHTGTK